MNLLIVGQPERRAELMSRLDGQDIHEVDALEGSPYATEGLDKFDVVFDLNFDDDPSGLDQYAFHDNLIVVVGAVKLQLAAAIDDHMEEVKCHLIGMNTLPTFMDRDAVEISTPNKEAAAAFEPIANSLGWTTHVVNDRVGMVTPRVVFMIINEACYTVQEGTATMEDIDSGMKLGTNYPHGPFEWADRVGIKDVYETLDALYHDTHEERYRICSLLKTKYLKGESFY
jgi:3-hydroxybutyryl-CoA dehydrogenase